MSFNKLTIIKESENEYSLLMMSEKQKDSHYKRMIQESGLNKFSHDLAEMRAFTQRQTGI
jgi:hypothetical protein